MPKQDLIFEELTQAYADNTLPSIHTLLNPDDSILAEFGDGTYKIFSDILDDDQVYTGCQQRITAQLAMEWKVSPGLRRGSSTRADKMAADSLRAQLAALSTVTDDSRHGYAKMQQTYGYDDLTAKAWYNLFYGMGVGENIYAKDGREVILEQVKMRRRDRFAIDSDHNLLLRDDGYTFRKGLPKGPIPGTYHLPKRKFWAFSVGAVDHDNPYGTGIAHWLYWPTRFKRSDVKLWLTFVEKHASPTVVGKYPPKLDTYKDPTDIATAAAIKASLLSAATSIKIKTGIAIPDNTVIELLEATRNGTNDYAAFFDRMQGVILKIILGQTSTAEGTPGKLGEEGSREKVKEQYVISDADIMCNAFSGQTGAWVTKKNYPTAVPPRVWRVTSSVGDMLRRADLDAKIFSFPNCPIQPSERYLTHVYTDEYELCDKREVTPEEQKDDSSVDDSGGQQSD